MDHLYTLQKPDDHCRRSWSFHRALAKKRNTEAAISVPRRAVSVQGRNRRISAPTPDDDFLSNSLPNSRGETNNSSCEKIPDSIVLWRFQNPVSNDTDVIQYLPSEKDLNNDPSKRDSVHSTESIECTHEVPTEESQKKRRSIFEINRLALEHVVSPPAYLHSNRYDDENPNQTEHLSLSGEAEACESHSSATAPVNELEIERNQIFVVGADKTGKSALIQNLYRMNSIDESKSGSSPTTLTNLELIEIQPAHLEMWLDQPHSCSVFLFVFNQLDLDSRKSAEFCFALYLEAEYSKNSKTNFAIMIGNMTDLRRNEENLSDARIFAQRNFMPFLEISYWNEANLTELWMIIKSYLNSSHADCSSSSIRRAHSYKNQQPAYAIQRSTRMRKTVAAYWSDSERAIRRK